jgi:hypothetical protein
MHYSVLICYKFIISVDFFDHWMGLLHFFIVCAASFSQLSSALAEEKRIVTKQRF